MHEAVGIDLPPKTMGRYQLLFRIAAGGMAEVFAARVLGEAGFQKLVALKKMLPNIADDEEFVTMFLDEAHVASNISNPHVVQTLDLGRDEHGSLYIVMELVVGVPLSRILKEANKVRKAVPVGMGIELIAQAGAGLDAAHEAVTPIGEPLQIVHRDVSPQNILVGVDGRVRLTDFGVARAVMRMTKTDAGRIKGKFAYCAPEQLRSESIDRRADIFALGVVAWETLAGQRLFVADHPLATMERVTTMPILPLDQIRSRVPKATSDVVLWALERDVSRRPPSAAAFIKELRRSAVQSGIELPASADITRFVQAAGGEPLRKMQNNIRVALAAGETDVLHDSAQFQLIEEPPSQVSGAIDTDMERQLQELSQPEPDSSGVSRVPNTLAPPTPTGIVDAEPKRPLAVYLGAGVAALVLLVGGLYFAFSGNGEPIAEPLAPAAQPEQAVVEEPDTLTQPPQPIDTEITPADEVAGGSGEEEGDEPEPETPADEAETAEQNMRAANRRWRNARRNRNRAATQQEAEPDPPQPDPPPVRRQATAAPAPMESEMASAMRGGLAGSDAFRRAAMIGN